MAKSPEISRVVKMDPAAEIGARVMAILGLPRPRNTDALAVCPGLGEVTRVTDAINDWHTNGTARLLLVSGTNPGEPQDIQPVLDLDTLKKSPYNLARTEGAYVQGEAAHTPAQAEWLAGRIEESGVTSVGLFVTPTHLPRAYSTVLATFDKRGLTEGGQGVQLIPRPARVAPTALIPEPYEVPGGETVQLNGIQFFAGEAERIRRYEPQGDVVSLPRLEEYLGWLVEQPVMRDAFYA